jgi:hypothetical protein
MTEEDKDTDKVEEKKENELWKKDL